MFDGIVGFEVDGFDNVWYFVGNLYVIYCFDVVNCFDGGCLLFGFGLNGGYLSWGMWLVYLFLYLVKLIEFVIKNVIKDDVKEDDNDYEVGSSVYNLGSGNWSLFWFGVVGKIYVNYKI